MLIKKLPLMRFFYEKKTPKKVYCYNNTKTKQKINQRKPFKFADEENRTATSVMSGNIHTSRIRIENRKTA